MATPSLQPCAEPPADVGVRAARATEAADWEEARLSRRSSAACSQAAFLRYSFAWIREETAEAKGQPSAHHGLHAFHAAEHGRCQEDAAGRPRMRCSQSSHRRPRPARSRLQRRPPFALLLPRPRLVRHHLQRGCRSVRPLLRRCLEHRHVQRTKLRLPRMWEAGRKRRDTSA